MLWQRLRITCLALIAATVLGCGGESEPIPPDDASNGPPSPRDRD
ncbi:MAG: hypothetical protein QGG36_01195 [Pirellulaceae bacterium]|nr:hypothetical protein [Pirellulaceae bacterium]MDP7014393.1 hypothetical protein [Pirellulaceae bacterium]